MMGCGCGSWRRNDVVRLVESGVKTVDRESGLWTGGKTSGSLSYRIAGCTTSGPNVIIASFSAIDVDQASSIQHPASSIQHPASSIQHLIPELSQG
jgi:hypothetical protein